MIKDITKNKVLSKECTICQSFFSHCIGLMFRKRIVPTVLAFKKPSAVSIHTFFVRKSIDVIFLDANCKVTSLVRGLKPWKIHTPKRKAVFVIELPEKTIEKSGVSVGDVISFK